jgi:hypothetical protein
MRLALAGSLTASVVMARALWINLSAGRPDLLPARTMTAAARA